RAESRRRRPLLPSRRSSTARSRGHGPHCQWSLREWCGQPARRRRRRGSGVTRPSWPGADQDEGDPVNVLFPALHDASPATALPYEPVDETPALVVYTSGTTGPPKGVVLSRRAIAHTLDALEDAWQWTAADVLVHALPLFHVHGLILGILGPLRRGGSVHHLG